MTDPGDDEGLPPPTDGQGWVDEIVARARSKASAPTPEPRAAAAPPPVDERLVPAEPVVPEPDPAPEVSAPRVPPGATPAPRARALRPDDLATDGPVLPPPRPPRRSSLDDDPALVGASSRRAASTPLGEQGIRRDDQRLERDEFGSSFFEDDPDEGDDPLPPRKSSNRALRSAVEWLAVIVGALVVALVIKTFLFQAFYIPSQSMEPTLHEGDRVLVNKLSYDLHDVNRGDIVVFEKPPGMTGTINDLIKRVIALPNETLELRDGRIYIDGRLLEEPYLPDGTVTNPKRVMSGCVGEPSDSRCVVPDETVLVMGDNRENSTDGRWFGPISVDSIVGRAFIKVYPLGDIGFL